MHVLREKGALKRRSYNSRPAEERRNQEELNQVQGMPWEPVPGSGCIEVKSRLQVEEDEEPIALMKTREVLPRKIYIRREHVAEDKNAPALGCKGREAAIRGVA